MKRACFFDRDGVITQLVRGENGLRPPWNSAEFTLLPDVQMTMKALCERDYLLFVVTNQPDVARGKLTAQTVSVFHDLLLRELPIEKIYCCLHDDQDNCTCRKPKSGSLLKAANEYGLDLISSYMIGDTWRDIEAGKGVGCKTILVDLELAQDLRSKPDYTIRQIKGVLDICK